MKVNRLGYRNGDVTIFHNALLDNPELSPSALLSVIMMLSREDSWEFSLKDLSDYFHDENSDHKVLSGLVELVNAGYLKKVPVDDPDSEDCEYMLDEAASLPPGTDVGQERITPERVKELINQPPRRRTFVISDWDPEDIEDIQDPEDPES